MDTLEDKLTKWMNDDYQKGYQAGLQKVVKIVKEVIDREFELPSRREQAREILKKLQEVKNG